MVVGSDGGICFRARVSGWCTGRGCRCSRSRADVCEEPVGRNNWWFRVSSGPCRIGCYVGKGMLAGGIFDWLSG